MAFTTWNPADKAANVTLSNGNLTAAGQSGCRAIDKQMNGKYYWEITYVTADISCMSGLVNQGAVINTFPQTSVGAVGGFGAFLVRSGSFQIDGLQVANMGVVANGSIVCFAWDGDARLIWCRNTPTGIWNNNALADPASGQGGFLTDGLGRGIPAYPYFYGGVPGETATANFGASPFAGAVPTGFTAGWVAGSLPLVNAVATQSSVEEWYTQAATPNEQGQITQAGVEMWASASSLIPSQGIITIVGIEMWAPVIATPIVAGMRPYAIILP